jgi:hypothetical protein
MGLFSREPGFDDFDDDEDIDSEPIQLYTNAPPHWPVVMSDPLIPEGVPGYDSMNAATFGGALKQAFEQSSCGCALNSVLKPLLTPEGILEIPFEVNDNGRMVPVFLYPDTTEGLASQYYGADRILKARGYEQTIYFAPGPLPQVLPGNPLRQFGADLLSRHQGEMTKGNYAMLWADDAQPNILATKCLKDIHRSFNALAGVESYVVASIFQKLGLVEAEVQRMKLPSKLMTIPIVGPEEQSFIISVSEGKGIRFHFNKQTTSAEYRDAFWSVFASYAEGWQEEATRQQMEKDYPKGKPPSFHNWTNTINILYKQGQDVAEFGVLTI